MRREKKRRCRLGLEIKYKGCANNRIHWEQALKGTATEKAVH